MSVQTIEARPFLDKDECIGRLDRLVDDVALAGVLGAFYDRVEADDLSLDCSPAA